MHSSVTADVRAAWLNNCCLGHWGWVMVTRGFQPVTEMLESGRCEPLKACVHAAVLVLAAVCAAYNTAAWFKRRQPHLAVNAVIYITTVWWERSHVVHHLAACAPVEAATIEALPTRLTDAA